MDYMLMKAGGIVPLGKAALPDVSSAAALFSSVPAGTRMVRISVRGNPITVQFDDTDPTAGANGIDLAVGTHDLYMVKENLENVKAIQNGGAATGYAVFFGLES
jgi:hypothetical protein